MPDLYYPVGLLLRVFFILLIAYLLCRWANFIHCWIKSSLLKVKLQKKTGHFFLPVNSIKSIFKLKPGGRPASKAVNLLAGGVFFLGGIFIYFFIPFGRAYFTFTELYSELTNFNIFYFAARKPGLLYLLFLILPLAIAGFYLSPEKDRISRIGKKRFDDLFFPAAISLGLVIMAGAAAASTLSPAELIDFQGENGWLFAYQLPGVFVYFLVTRFFFYRFFYNNFSKLDSAYKRKIHGIEATLYTGGEQLYTVGISSLMVVLFFGGGRAPFYTWEGWKTLTTIPGVDYIWEFSWFFCKLTVLFSIFSFTRLTLGRLSHRQVRALLWKLGVSLAAINLISTSFITGFYGPLSAQLFLASLLIFAVTLVIIRFGTLQNPTEKTVTLEKNKNSSTPLETGGEKIDN